MAVEAFGAPHDGTPRASNNFSNPESTLSFTSHFNFSLSLILFRYSVKRARSISHHYLSPYPFEESIKHLFAWFIYRHPLEHYQQNKVNKSIIMRSILSERKRQICLHACCDRSNSSNQLGIIRKNAPKPSRDQYISFFSVRVSHP